MNSPSPLIRSPPRGLSDAPFGKKLARESVAKPRFVNDHSLVCDVEGVVLTRRREGLTMQGEAAVAVEVVTLWPRDDEPEQAVGRYDRAHGVQAGTTVLSDRR